MAIRRKANSIVNRHSSIIIYTAMPKAFQNLELFKKSALISVNLCQRKKTQNKPILEMNENLLTHYPLMPNANWLMPVPTKNKPKRSQFQTSKSTAQLEVSFTVALSHPLWQKKTKNLIFPGKLYMMFAKAP